MALENMGFDSVLGIIAGRDNCVFICLREGVSGEQFLRELKDRIPELEDWRMFSGGVLRYDV